MYGCAMDVGWMCYGCVMDVVWMRYGYRMDIVWMFYGCFADVRWISYGCCICCWREIAKIKDTSQSTSELKLHHKRAKTTSQAS